MAENSEADRRKTWRVRVEVLVKVESDGREIQGYSEDIGGGGCRFLSKYQLADGEKVSLVIPEFSKIATFRGSVLQSSDVDFSKDFRTRIQYIDAEPATLDRLINFLYRKAFH